MLNYNERRRLVNAVLQSKISIDVKPMLLLQLAANHIQTPEVLAQFLRNHDLVVHVEQVNEELAALYQRSPQFTTPAQTSDLLWEIKKLSASLKKKKDTAYQKFLDLHYGYLGISLEVLNAMEGRVSDHPLADTQPQRDAILRVLSEHFTSTMLLLIKATNGELTPSLREALAYPVALENLLSHGPITHLNGFPIGRPPESVLLQTLVNNSAELLLIVNRHSSAAVIAVVECLLSDTPQRIIQSVIDRGIHEPLDALKNKDFSESFGFRANVGGLGCKAAYKPLHHMTLGESLPTAPERRSYNVIDDLQAKLDSYAMVTRSDEINAVILKMLGMSPLRALRTLFELDVIQTSMKLTEAQLPSAMLYIYSRIPDDTHPIEIPKVPEGTAHEKVEFVIYWTILSCYMSNNPLKLSAMELETVFSYIHSIHYRTTLLHIV